MPFATLLPATLSLLHCYISPLHYYVRTLHIFPCRLTTRFFLNLKIIIVEMFLRSRNVLVLDHGHAHLKHGLSLQGSIMDRLQQPHSRPVPSAWVATRTPFRRATQTRSGMALRVTAREMIAGDSLIPTGTLYALTGNVLPVAPYRAMTGVMNVRAVERQLTGLKVVLEGRQYELLASHPHHNQLSFFPKFITVPILPYCCRYRNHSSSSLRETVHLCFQILPVLDTGITLFPLHSSPAGRVGISIW